MPFTVHTNTSSLTAREYLRITGDFQERTINRVSSGLHIVRSGDDAAGLAIANGFRSDRAVITQGIRNANDGLSTLQTVDGGINNISQLLDRARSLATQSASGTFNGDRTVLDIEFQSVIDEIDRQAQAIGLNTGGLFAKDLEVFIGGGRGITATQQISNGSIAVDLSNATVDARSLGLKGTQVAGVNATDVDEILAEATNISSQAVSGWTDFYFRGPGFAAGDRVRVAVNLSGVDNPDKLVRALNSAIDQAGSGGTGPSTAFRDSGIRAAIVTDEADNKNLVFQSSETAFQVSGGDRLANALLGNHANNTGFSVDYVVTGATAAASTGTTFAAARDVVVRIQGGSLASPTDLTLSVTTSTSVDQALTSLSSLIANNSSLIAAGISLSAVSPGSALQFTSRRGENFEVLAVNDAGNRLGLGTAQNTSSTSPVGFDVTSVTSGAVTTGSGAATLAISVGGGAYQTLSHTFSGSTTAAELVNSLNTQFASIAALQQAGLVAASAAGGAVSISSNNGTYFRVSSNSAGAGFGFGTLAGVTTSTSVATTSSTTSASLSSGGASVSPLLSWAPIRNGNDDQAITISTEDSAGTEQSVAITLAADSGAQHGRTIDEALAYINAQIQASGSADLRLIVAVKQRDPAAGGAEKIRFLGLVPAFSVSIGGNPGGTGIASNQGQVVNSTLLAGGANADIASQPNAEAAVVALYKAVAKVGNVQAVVGRGQNQFNFAISLAHTQLITLGASESRIRDADLAEEAANLSKAQVLQQAGIAALSQANAAPQAILNLLRS
jgi:flagellin